MSSIDTNVELKYPSREWAAQKAFPGGDLGLSATSEDSLWAAERPKIVSAFNELMESIESKDTPKV
jgi:hypothetical protein